MGKRIKKEFFAKKASLVALKMIGLKLCTPSCEVVLCETEAYEGANDLASHAYTLTERSRLMHETYAHWYVYFIYGNHHCLNITCGKKEAGAVLIRGAIPVKGVPLMRKRRKRLEGKKLRHKYKKSNSGFGEKSLSEKVKTLADELKGICDGPGKLCQALGIDKKYNGLELGKKLWLEKTNSWEKKIVEKQLQHNKYFLEDKKRIFKHNKVVGEDLKTRLDKIQLKKTRLKKAKLKEIVLLKTKLRIIASPRIGISKAKRKKWRFRIIAGQKIL